MTPQACSRSGPGNRVGREIGPPARLSAKTSQRVPLSGSGALLLAATPSPTIWPERYNTRVFKQHALVPEGIRELETTVPAVRDDRVPVRAPSPASLCGREVQTVDGRRNGAFFRRGFIGSRDLRFKWCVAPHLKTPRAALEVRQNEPVAANPGRNLAHTTLDGARLSKVTKMRSQHMVSGLLAMLKIQEI